VPLNRANQDAVRVPLSSDCPPVKLRKSGQLIGTEMRNEFRNDASYKERADQLSNERKLRPGDSAPSTFFQMANLDPSLEGRFAPGGYVVGSELTPAYPAAAGPWAAGPQPPPEQPTGVAIDAMEPTGTAVEIERSLGGPSAPVGMVPGSETTVATPPTVKTGPPIPSARRKV
jgi:hypothetical protein